MRDPRRLPRRDRKSRRDCRDHDRDRKELLPPQQNRNRAKPDRNDGGHRQHRLMIGGKIEGDAGTEGDGHPGQQPPGPGFRARPLAQGLDELRPQDGTRWREASDRRGGSRRPRPGIAPFPARRIALLRHATKPYDLIETTRLPDAALWPLAERMQKLERTRPPALPADAPTDLRCRTIPAWENAVRSARLYFPTRQSVRVLSNRDRLRSTM